MSDQFEGQGGSYAIDKNGNRKKIEGTLDKLASPAVDVEVPVLAEPVEVEKDSK